MPALSARNLVHEYGSFRVLHGVSLDVAPGEVVAVAGPSGSGKSTLLHLLGGLDRPTAGEVLWAGERVDGLDGEARALRRARRVGLVFQHHYLLPDLSVLDNVALPALVLGREVVPGVNGEGEWAEPSYVVVGMGLAEARELGRRFRQAAVLWGVGWRVALVWCDGRRRARDVERFWVERAPRSG